MLPASAPGLQSSADASVDSATKLKADRRSDFGKGSEGEVAYWVAEIKASEKETMQWRQVAARVVKRYRDERQQSGAYRGREEIQHPLVEHQHHDARGVRQRPGTRRHAPLHRPGQRGPRGLDHPRAVPRVPNLHAARLQLGHQERIAGSPAARHGLRVGPLPERAGVTDRHDRQGLLRPPLRQSRRRSISSTGRTWASYRRARGRKCPPCGASST